MPFLQDLVRPSIRLATNNRIILYGVLSMLSVSLVVFNAFKDYSNFYSVAVYLSRSNRSVLALANFGIFCSLLVGHGFQQIFFGSLRATEVERLYDKIWFFLTESLFAFTIFRDEFDVNFGILFGLLLFVKCFHWLMVFRIEWMDQIQYPGPNKWFHIRMNTLFLILWSINVVMLSFAVDNILTHGVNGTILFASEYAILIASLINSIAKYLILVYDIRRAHYHGGENAPVWEDKSMFIFYIELATDFLKLITYLTFFLVVMTFYGLPLNIVRDIYVTARSFYQRCRDLVRYRIATRNMDERYPNATEEELVRMNDRTCIICREEMVARAAPAQDATQPATAGVNDTPKKLPCGHVFHFHCLRSWLERQQSCPTCRRTVFETTPEPQNAQGQPRALPPPHPGAMPQFAGVRPQGQGFLARWLGGAGAAPPIVPGQFAHGPGAFNPPQPNPFPLNQGWPAQNQFGVWQHPGPQHHVPPPVQVLQGFYIGNQWQPWGQQQQQPIHPQPAQPAQAANAAPPSTQTVPAENAGQPSTSNTPDTRNSVASSQSPHNNNTNSGSVTPPTDSGRQREGISPDHVSTPRNAAALAAMRRFNSANSGGDSSSMSPTASGSQGGQSVARAEARPATTTDPITAPGDSVTQSERASLPPLIPTPTTEERSSGPGPSTLLNQNPPVSVPPQTTRVHHGPVPSLIPLFDPATTQATIVAPPNLMQNRIPFNAQYAPQTLRPRYNLNTGQLPDFRTLPQTLTQEQLDRLDVLTREAIDERLRALENIQTVMWRCSEELIRMRSVLPIRREEQARGQASSSSGSNATSTSTATGSTSIVSDNAPSTSGTTTASPGSSDTVIPAAVAVEPESTDVSVNPGEPVIDATG